MKVVRLLFAWACALALVASVGAAAAGAQTKRAKAIAKSKAAQAEEPQTILAQPFAKVTPLYPTSPVFGHVTLLESPVFGPGGLLYFVDLTAPAGKPKVLALNLKTKGVRFLHTDSTSSLASIQFSPKNGKAYATDLFNGDIYRMNADGSGWTTVFSGNVGDRPMQADDIEFNRTGNDFYVSDTAGTPFNPIGRVVHFDADPVTGDPINPTVMQDGLAGANGISFSPDQSELWVSEFNYSREDHFTLGADGKTFTSGAVGMYASEGNNGFDSNSVDASGNVYQCVYQGGRILVWNSDGDLLATIRIPQTLPKPQMGTTNMAIKPGTNQGFITVGGQNGGYIYTFTALGKGIQPSNGGSAIFK
jgi:lactonase